MKKGFKVLGCTMVFAAVVAFPAFAEMPDTVQRID